jgi:hypothetical protein
MKKWLVILFLFLVPAVSTWAQEDDAAQEGGKIQDRMREYIQDKLGLSKAEAQKFTPVFVRYFREFAQTHRQYKGDKLILKQRIIDLRIRYRTEFRQIMDEQRANKVYYHEDNFRKEAIQIIKENRRDRIPTRRTRTVLLD